MTSIVVPKNGLACPICVEYVIEKITQMGVILTTKKLEIIWNHFGILTSSPILFSSIVNYNKHLELHASNLPIQQFITKGKFKSMFKLSRMESYIVCTKCGVMLRTIDTATKHFAIHDFLSEKMGNFEKDIVDFTKYFCFNSDSGKICCNLCTSDELRDFVKMKRSQHDFADDPDDYESIADILERDIGEVEEVREVAEEEVEEVAEDVEEEAEDVEEEAEEIQEDEDVEESDDVMKKYYEEDDYSDDTTEEDTDEDEGSRIRHAFQKGFRRGMLSERYAPERYTPEHYVEYDEPEEYYDFYDEDIFIDNKSGFTPRELLNHFVMHLARADIKPDYCPHCMSSNRYDEKDWKQNHSCFAKIEKLREYLGNFMAKENAVYALLTYHKLAQNVKDSDSFNCLQIVDKSIIRNIIRFMY